MKIEVEISISDALKALFTSLIATLGGAVEAESKPKPKKESAAAKKKRLAAEAEEENEGKDEAEPEKKKPVKKKDAAKKKDDDDDDDDFEAPSEQQIGEMKKGISSAIADGDKGTKAKIMELMKEDYNAERMSEIHTDKVAEFILAVGLL